MCIRDSLRPLQADVLIVAGQIEERADAETTCPLARLLSGLCLLYTSDAADERSSVDLGGRRIIKKKTSRVRRDVHTH